ncbi:hypothetical protein ACVWZ1_002151 [Thermostichus sp. MS-CIW-25]
MAISIQTGTPHPHRKRWFRHRVVPQSRRRVSVAEQ